MSVGLVIVSHMPALAEASVALARLMAPADAVTIVTAAGLSDGSVGTDAMAVAEAITMADSGAGVLVLCDLGSALLSADMALEMLDPDIAERTVVSGASLVEGIVAAAVTAAGGADLLHVRREAEHAHESKSAYLLSETVAAPAALVDARAVAAGDIVEATAVLADPAGLHARPAAIVAAIAAEYESEIDVVGPDGDSADAESAMALMALGVRAGAEVRVRAKGPDAAPAVAEVVEALTHFG